MYMYMYIPSFFSVQAAVFVIEIYEDKSFFFNIYSFCALKRRDKGGEDIKKFISLKGRKKKQFFITTSNKDLGGKDGWEEIWKRKGNNFSTCLFDCFFSYFLLDFFCI